MPTIKGSKELQAKLRKKVTKAQKDNGSVVMVGYTAEYAIYVHENLAMKWKGLPRKGKRPDGTERKGNYWDPAGQGQSQYLIQPFREKHAELMAIVKHIYKKTKDITLSLTVAGQRLQAESQELVPVDIGNLKQSAFTKVER